MFISFVLALSNWLELAFLAAAFACRVDFVSAALTLVVGLERKSRKNGFNFCFVSFLVNCIDLLKLELDIDKILKIFFQCKITYRAG